MQYRFIYSYNPPQRKQHWLNKKYESQNIPANTYVHHSSYQDNHYLAPQTLEDIENLRIINERKWRWMYLGEPSGGGVVPFDNLVFRSITGEEIEHFDNIKQGLDFGYAVDPVCWGKMHYDRTRRKLFIFDEIYGVKISNRELAVKIKEKLSENILTICDSAEPKSIAELQEFGINVMGASKGEGSVEFGEKWLDDLTEIVIDPNRCPNHAREFENIDYQVDRNGELMAKLEEKNNHAIDETRYACEDCMQESWVWSA
jgi:PBSX family phage terminase large subunit